MLGSPRRRLPGSRQVRLSVAAFGKHPAWRDHIDEDVLIAAGTEELALLERWLHGATFEEFTSKSAINTLSPDNLIPFDHLIVRSGLTGCSLTRVWASTDYTGRAQFPMAISIDAEGMGVDDAMRRVLPALETCAAKVREIGDALRAKIDAEDPAHSGSVDAAGARRQVREAVEAFRQQIGAAVTSAAETEPDAAALLRELQAHADSGPGGQGLARVIYRLERLKPSDGGSRSMTRSQAARRWRLPRAAESDDQSVRRWLAFLSFLAPDLSMITLALPRQHPWVDLMLGDVGVGELERMRLSEKAESVESRTSYSAVNSAYISATEATMEGWLRDGPQPAAPAAVVESKDNGKAAAAPAKKGFGRRWTDWLIGGGGAIALAALAAYFASGRGAKHPAIAEAPAATTPAAPTGVETPKPVASMPPTHPKETPAPKPAPPVETAAAKTPVVPTTSSPSTPKIESPKAALPAPVASKFAADAAGATFTIVPVAAAWNASIAEAERSTDPPGEVRQRLDLTRRGLQEIERATIFPADTSEPPAATDAARRIWEPKATAIASELAGTAVRDARAGKSLSREQAEAPVADLAHALKATRERGGAYVKAGKALRDGRSLIDLGVVVPEEPWPAAPPGWDGVDRIFAGDSRMLLHEAAQVWATTSVDKLLETGAARDNFPLGLAQTAWDRLADLSPAMTPEQIDSLTGAHRSLIARVGAANAPALDAARERARRIVGVRLSSAPMDDRVGLACSRALDAIGPGEGKAPLAPAAAANLALVRLKTAAPGETDTAKLRAQAAAIAAAHNIPIPLPDANPQAQKADPELFRTVGPAAKGWAVAMSPDLEQATFTLNKLTLKFLRVASAPEVGGGAAYLCTTELSVAVMLDTLERSNGWNAFGQLIALPGSDGEDPRAGIRTWHFGRRDLSRLEPATVEGRPDAKAWLNLTCTYPDAATPPPPTPNAPAQYLSFAAAVHLSAALGCRLPSSGEWLSAAQRIPERTRGWNRRDAAWLRYAQHYAQHPCPAGSPAAEAFHIGAGDQARPAVTEDDGVLWLADVNAGPDVPFKHLIGNVAEWCFEQPGQLDARLSVADPKQWPRLSTTEARIVGASALSEAEMEPLKAYPVSDVDAAAPLGFSDVGVRLAFSSPVGKAGTELHQIRQAILAAPYRTAP